MSMKPTSLAVLVDSHIREYELFTLERAVEETGIDIPVVLINKPQKIEVDPDLEAKAIGSGLGIHSIRLFFKSVARDRSWALVYAERKIAEQLGATEPSSKRIPVENVTLFSDAEIYRVTPVNENGWTKLPEETIQLIGEKCDVVLRYGFGLIKGDILTTTEYGVLSFHPADIREYRGLGVPQAWIDDKEVMGVTLQRLSEDIDGGGIVAYRESYVGDCATLWECYERLYRLHPDLLVEGIENLRDPTFEITVPESLGPYYPTSNKQKLSFATKTLFKNIYGRIRKIFK